MLKATWLLIILKIVDQVFTIRVISSADNETTTVMNDSLSKEVFKKLIHKAEHITIRIYNNEVI